MNSHFSRNLEFRQLRCELSFHEIIWFEFDGTVLIRISWKTLHEIYHYMKQQRIEVKWTKPRSLSSNGHWWHLVFADICRHLSINWHLLDYIPNNLAFITAVFGHNLILQSFLKLFQAHLCSETSSGFPVEFRHLVPSTTGQLHHQIEAMEGLKKFRPHIRSRLCKCDTCKKDTKIEEFFTKKRYWWTPRY